MKTLILLTLISIINLNASEKWQDPSEKYISSYKQYINAKCPLENDNIKHFVYFARDRDSIHNHHLLKNQRFKGAQIMYPWEKLETTKDNYDFSIINEDYNYLKSYGKKLFIQLQDTTFNPKYKAIPSYLELKEYDGGAIPQTSENGKHEGWVAKRWNKNVQERFAKLLMALGKEFDGKIEGINLQESSIEISYESEKSFTNDIYVESLKKNMLSLKQAFPESTTMQYANFMPGEWLPWEDKGYLKSIYNYGEKIGVGLGAPDLMFNKKGQLNHTITMMHEYSYSVPIGIAIQDGNYIGETNTDLIKKERKNLVPVLHAFAKNFLKVNYMFWVNQEPYFEQDVMPCFN